MIVSCACSPQPRLKVRCAKIGVKDHVVGSAKRVPRASRAVVGEQHVLTRRQDTEPYFTDWRRQYRADADCVLRPAGTAEVAQLVRLCAQEGVAVVPQGATPAVRRLGATGTRPEVVLSLARLNRIASSTR